MHDLESQPPRSNASAPIDTTLDVTGLNCPLPILKTKVALNSMLPGQVIQVYATDPMAVVDFRAFCARTGHDLLTCSEQSGVLEFVIRKVAQPAIS